MKIFIRKISEILNMNKLTEIYDSDFHLWIQRHIELLKTGKTNELDIEHLIEELEDMGKSNVRELESRFLILIAHLLKWQFQLKKLQTQWEKFEGKSWRSTIIEQRTLLLFLLKKVPSLKSALAESVKEAYPESVKLAAKESKLPKQTFPTECPYTIEQLLDEDFYPNG